MDQMRVMKSMADETRYRILHFLVRGEKCVCEIVPHVKRTQSTVSIHLNNMEKEGILESRRVGKKIFYSLSNPKVLKLIKILEEQ